MFIFDNKISDIKRLDLALRKCPGIGINLSIKVLVRMGFNMKTKVKDLPIFVFKHLDQRVIELIQIVFFNAYIGLGYKNFLRYRMKKIFSVFTYKRFRHLNYLPVHGQRSKNNAQTQKNKRLNRKRIPISLGKSKGKKKKK